MNLLGVLANQAASEYNAATSTARNTLPEYLRDYAGEAVTDVAVAENRARALSELLQRTEIEQEHSETSESAIYYRHEREMEAADSEYDAMDLADVGGFSDEY